MFSYDGSIPSNTHIPNIHFLCFHCTRASVVLVSVHLGKNTLIYPSKYQGRDLTILLINIHTMLFMLLAYYFM